MTITRGALPHLSVPGLPVKLAGPGYQAGFNQSLQRWGGGHLTLQPKLRQ